MSHVTIIGAGVIGLAAAHECVQRGQTVTIIDRHSLQRGGCSFGNAGMVVPSHFVPLAAPGMVALGLKWMWNPESPFYIKPRLSWDLITWALRFWAAANAAHVRAAAPLLRDLSLASRARYDEMATVDGMEFGLAKNGLLMLCRTAHAFDEESQTAARARALGIPADVLDRSQTAALDPAVTMDVEGSVYFPQDCHLSPTRLMAELQHRLARRGVQFLWDTEVTGWRREGARLAAVVTSRGEIESSQFVLAGGSWSPPSCRALGLRLPMQAGKGYSLTLNTPRQLPSLCSILTEARVAVTPMDGALRVGGTMEIAGMNEDVTRRRVTGIIKAVPTYFPEFRETDFADLEPWCGLRPCSPDGLPYLGRTAAARNLVIATGHAMMGLSLAPVTGQIVDRLVAGEPPQFDLRLLSPDRFA